MAIVTRKATGIGNRDASPNVPVNASVMGGIVKAAEGFVTATNADSATSYYPMFQVPSNARIHELTGSCAALGAGAKLNVGVFWPTVIPPLPPGLNFGTVAAGGAVSTAGATLFASVWDVSGALAPVDITNQSTNNPLATQEQELWQACGLAQDPGCNFDIGAVVNVAIAATGTLSLKALYSN